MGLNRRIKELEDNMLQPIEWGSTRIAYDELPEAEQRLFDKVRRIIEAHRYADTVELEPWEMKLIDQASEIMWVRAIDIFNTVIGYTVHRDNPTGKLLWNMWFGFFMEEMCEAIPQRVAEDEIYGQKGKSWKQKKAEADKLYESWVKPFSEKRLDAYINRMLNRKPKACRKKKVTA